METKIDVSRIVGSSDPITIWNSQSLNLKRRTAHPMFQILSDSIDGLGKRSQLAQGLNNVLTSTQKLFDCPDQRVYLFATENQFIGILKVGHKKLFHRTRQGALVELNDLLCVLDFYVHENYQRGGIGRALFDTMLEREQRDPATFGYDRPSPKLVAFLRKHFGLADYVPQTNNFIVFDRFFEMLKSTNNNNGTSVGQPDYGRRSIGKGPSALVSSSTSTPTFSNNSNANHNSVARALESFHKNNNTSASNSANSSKTTSPANPNNNENIAGNTKNMMMMTMSKAGQENQQQQQQRLMKLMNSNQANNAHDAFSSSPGANDNPSPQKQIPMPHPQQNNTNQRSIYSTAATTSNQQYGRNSIILNNFNHHQNEESHDASTGNSKKLGPLLSTSNPSSALSNQNNQHQQQASSGIAPITTSSAYRSTADPTSIGLGTSTTSVYHAAIRGNVSTGIGSFGGGGRTRGTAGRFF